MNRVQRDKIIEHINKVLAASGVHCLEVDWEQRILRVFIEPVGEETQVNLDDCVAATRLLNQDTELDNTIDGPYTLEVSSPGLERPLRTMAHFSAHIGNEIEVKLSQAWNERKHAKGVLVAVDSRDDGEFVKIETARGEWEFPLSELSRAHIVYDWNSAN